MNLSDLSAAITDYSDGVRVEGPEMRDWRPWMPKTTWEIHVTDRLCGGREVTVTSDGVALVMPHLPAPQRVQRKRLPDDVERAAEIVVELVYG
jgi:hypothetical protein